MKLQLYKKDICRLWIRIAIIFHLILPTLAQREGRFFNHLFRSGLGDPPTIHDTANQLSLSHPQDVAVQLNQSPSYDITETLTLSPPTTRATGFIDQLPHPTAAISTDDVYIGLADLFNKPKTLYTLYETTTSVNRIQESYVNNMENSYLETDMWKPKNNKYVDLEKRIKQNDSEDNLISNNYKLQNTINSKSFLVANSSEEETKNPLNYKEFNQKYWMRLKSIIGNMKSIFTQMYTPDTEVEKSLYGIFDKVIEFGDSVNVISRIYETFDHELIDFLGNKWFDVKDTIFNSSPFMKTVMSLDIDTYGMSHTVLKKLGHLLHDQAFKLSSENDFVIELMRNTGFKDNEIAQVFNLLEIKTDLQVNNNTYEIESRQYGSRINYNRNNIDRNGYDNTYSNDRYESSLNNIEKSGGYGHSGGGYEECHGYSCMEDMFDPFILLAGLAAAAFLAYIIYRLLSSTMAKRGVADMGLALDLSDLPEVMGDIYNWLENTEEKYGYEEDSENGIEESFGSLANNLWASFAADRTPDGCARRFLCDYVQDNTNRMLGAGATFNILVLTGLSQLFGDITSSKMVDNLHNNLLDGQDLACALHVPSCDDVTYHTALNITTGVIH